MPEYVYTGRFHDPNAHSSTVEERQFAFDHAPACHHPTPSALSTHSLDPLSAIEAVEATNTESPFVQAVIEAAAHQLMDEAEIDLDLS